MKEWYCVVSGTRYGPIEMAELLDWARQGRLSAEDLVWKEDMPEWLPARSIPELAGEAKPSAAAAMQQAVAPHRGGVILALGIIGLICCFICGIVAWVMGSKDLREIDAGRMDSAGRGMVVAGKICGMIGVFVNGGLLLVQIVITVIGLLGAWVSGRYEPIE